MVENAIFQTTISPSPAMKCLIVHAHPEPRSFSSALKEAARETLSRQEHEVQLSDLYAMGFNPVASADDFLEPANPEYCVYALEQRHAVQHHSLSPDIQAELDKLLWCDLLILNFPLYWCSTPAIMKGWIDRVFVSGLVYGGKRFYNRGGLAGRRALVSVTLGGQVHMFQPEGIHGPLPELLKPLLQGTLAYAGFQVLPPFIGWHIPYLTDPERSQILEQWQQRLRHLEQDVPLPMPSLQNFDEQLRPRKT